MSSSRFSVLASFLAFALVFLLISALLIAASGQLYFNDISAAGDASYPPTVVIDAGHGGEDGGTVGVNGCFEKDVNLSMAKKLQTLLSSMGINSVLTRSTDTLLYDRNADYEGQKKRLDMQARLDITRSYDNAVFISIHQNAFPQEKYSGFQVYYSTNDEGSQVLAQSLEEDVRDILQPNNNRKAKASGGNIYLLDKLECPAVLVECGFLSNDEECALLCSEEYQNRLCAVMALSIAHFIEK